MSIAFCELLIPLTNGLLTAYCMVCYGKYSFYESNRFFLFTSFLHPSFLFLPFLSLSLPLVLSIVI